MGYFLKKSYLLLLCLFIFQINAQYLASGYRKGSIKIYDTSREVGKELIKTLDGKEGDVASVDFSPFYPSLLVAGLGSSEAAGAVWGEGGIGKIKIWDISRGPGYELIRTLDGHNGKVSSVNWSPFYPNLLVSGSYDGTVKIWDISREPGDELIKTLDGDGGSVYSASWSPFYKDIVASASQDGVVKIWDISKEKYEELINTLAEGKINNFSIAFSSFDKDFLASGFKDSFSIWNISKRRKGKGLIKSFSNIYANALVFSPFFPNILVAGGSSGITICDLSKGPGSRGHQIRINVPGSCLAFSFFDNILAAGSGSYRFNVIRIFDLSKPTKPNGWSPQGYTLVKTLKGEYGDTILCLAFSKQKKEIPKQEKKDVDERIKYLRKQIKELDTRKFKIKFEDASHPGAFKIIEVPLSFIINMKPEVGEKIKQEIEQKKKELNEKIKNLIEELERLKKEEMNFKK